MLGELRQAPPKGVRLSTLALFVDPLPEAHRVSAERAFEGPNLRGTLDARVLSLGLGSALGRLPEAIHRYFEGPTPFASRSGKLAGELAVLRMALTRLPQPLPTRAMHTLAERLRVVMESPDFDVAAPEERLAIFAGALQLFQEFRSPAFRTWLDDSAPVRSIYHRLLDELSAGNSVRDLDSPKLRHVLGLYDLTFHLWFAFLSDYTGDQAAIRTSVCRPFARALDRLLGPPAPRRRARAKSRRIGILAFHISTTGHYSPGRMTQSLALGLLAVRARHDIEHLSCYSILTAEPEARQELEAAGARVFEIPKDRGLEYLAERARADELDLLIYDLFLGPSMALAARRLAPIQVYFSSGFAQPMTPGLDAYLLVDNHAPASELEIDEDRAIVIPMPISRRFLSPEVSTTSVEAARLALRLPAGSFVFGNFSRFEKFGAEFIRCAAEILELNPAAVLLLCGRGDRGPSGEAFRELGVADRTRLLGQIDPHVYGQLLDGFLDSHPLCGGLSPLEAQAKGVPVVFMSSPGVRAIEKQRDPALIASSEAEYVRLAGRLASDGAWLSERKSVARAVADRCTNLERPADSFLGEAFRRESAGVI
ncbi:MAG: hypothetical protein HY791_24795 [Deltaproteobacteria bacterium]|nr:hypothetical protein [Deltaproteobacteria bacterium]